jgi:hypothetical protein
VFLIDYTGNRVAAMIYGPEKVIIVVGVNKIVDTLDFGMRKVDEIRLIYHCLWWVHPAYPTLTQLFFSEN